MKQAGTEGIKPSRYFDVGHSAISARQVNDSTAVDTLDLKLAQIEAIALMLMTDGVDEVTMNALGAISMMAGECKLLSQALWNQVTQSSGVAA